MEPEAFNSPGSVLRNPLISAVFYDIDWAETKGTGLRTALGLLKKEGFSLPEFSNDKLNDRFILKLAQPFWTDYITPQVTPQVTDQVTDQVSLQVAKQIEKMDRIISVLKFCEVPRSLAEILKFFNLKDRKYLLKSIIKPLVEEGRLERTIPDKPTSRFQKYTAVKSK